MRICGICKRSPRGTDGMQPLRVEANDVPGFTVEPGLYQACEECIEAAKPALAARLGVTVDNLPSFV